MRLELKFARGGGRSYAGHIFDSHTFSGWTRQCQLTYVVDMCFMT